MNDIKILDLADKITKLSQNEIVFSEFNQIIEEINKIFDNLEFDLQKNMEQHLHKFKKENDLSDFSEEEKICKFIEFVDFQNFEYFKKCQKELLKNVNNLNEKTYEVYSKINNKAENLKEKQKNRTFGAKIKNLIKKDETKNLDLYFFKAQKITDIFLKLYGLEVEIKKINIDRKNDIDFNIIKKEINSHNKLYTLDQFVKENPLFQKKFSYLNIKPYNEELKLILNKFNQEKDKLLKNSELNVQKKFELFYKRLTDNILYEIALVGLNSLVLKTLCNLGDKIKVSPEEALKKLTTGALVLVMGSQISPAFNEIIKKTDLSKVPYLQETFKIATSEYDKMVSSGVDIYSQIQTGNVKFSKSGMDKLNEIVNKSNKIEYDKMVNQNKKEQIDIG